MPNGDDDGMGSDDAGKGHHPGDRGSDDPGKGHHPGDRYMVELAFVWI